MSSPEPTSVLRVIILGTDAILAARPATPIQLARACMRAGFDFVAPVSWGEELLAEHMVQALLRQRTDAAIAVCCPFVAESLREEKDPWPRRVVMASPPVATARYLRAAFDPRTLHVTYAGACPGATAPDVDASLEPFVLLNSLYESGLAPEEQPNFFEELVPPDRARHASIPGGIPDAQRLLEATGLRLREAAPATVKAILPVFGAPERILIDLEVAVGCVCARDRFAATRLEPPRAIDPVVSYALPVEVEVDAEVDGEGRGSQPNPMTAQDDHPPTASAARVAGLWTAGVSAVEPWAPAPRAPRLHAAQPLASPLEFEEATPHMPPVDSEHKGKLPSEESGAARQPDARRVPESSEDVEALAAGPVTELVVPLGSLLTAPADLPRAVDDDDVDSGEPREGSPEDTLAE